MLHQYQIKAIKFIKAHLKCALFLDMGLGKTLITLKALEEMGAHHTLIIAPLTVAQHTWDAEIDKWDINLSISKVLGTPAQRKKSLEVEADLYITNRENVTWLFDQGYTDWRCIVVDELSSFKSYSAKRFKALKKFNCRRFIGLTGTPVANGLMDLWPQIYLLDSGERLGKYITNFRLTYFRPGKSRGHVVYGWIPLKDSDTRIFNATKDIVLRMEKDKDQLPGLIETVETVHLSDSVMNQYRELKRESILEYEKNTVVAGGPAALISKLLQLSSGVVYGEEENIKIHQEKLRQLETVMEALNGKPLIIFYNFISEKESLLKALKNYRVSLDDFAGWNKGKYDVLLLHPKSCAYGLNLQDGGSNILWYGLTWSLELYEQANARLWRQGQKNTVVIQHSICKNTAEEVVYKALKTKSTVQEMFLSLYKEEN